MEAVETLALVGGHVNEELLARNEYLAAENEILRSKIEGPVRLGDGERIRLAEIRKRIGLKALKDVACIVKPETILKWFRDLVANKFDGSKKRAGTGHPEIDSETEELILRFARENPGWGYDRIVGALANLGCDVCDQTVGNILKRNGIPPAPVRDRETTWSDFIQSHKDVLAACDFFTTEVVTSAGLITYYVLFFIKIATREVFIAGMTPNPDEKRMCQIARNLTMAEWGFLSDIRYLIHDRDSKFCLSFREILKAAGVKPIRLPPKSPNLNAHAERWVRSVKDECLSRLVLFGEESLPRALKEYVEHYHSERNHQGMENRILFPDPDSPPVQIDSPVLCRQRLGGLLKFYYKNRDLDENGRDLNGKSGLTPVIFMRKSVI